MSGEQPGPCFASHDPGVPIGRVECRPPRDLALPRLDKLGATTTARWLRGMPGTFAVFCGC
jgi:hypothetical protein